MKQTKLICLLALMVWGGMKNVNAQLIKQWVDTTDYSTGLTPSKIRMDSQGNVYSLALIPTAPDYTMLTEKRNANGTLLWSDSLVQPNIYASDMQVDATGNVYSFGRFGGTGNQAWLVKYSSSGVQQWVYTPSDYFNGPSRIRIDNAGNVVLGYETLDSIQCYDASNQQTYYYGVNGVKFLKIDGGGNVVMNFHYQPASCNGFFSLVDGLTPFDIDAAGNIYCSYITSTQNTGIMTYNVMKINTSGGIDWNNVYNSGIYYPNGYSVNHSDLKYDAATQHVLTTIAIYTDTSSTHYYPVLKAIDNAGNFLWNNSDPNGNSQSRIETDGSGNVYWGYYSNLGGGANFTVKKVSPTGTSLWSVVAAGTVNADMSLPSYDQSPGYTVENAGNLYYMEWYNADGYNLMHIHKISAAGAELWQYGGTQTGWLTNWLTNDNNGNLFYYGREYFIKYNPCTLPGKPGAISVSGGIAAVCPGETRTYTTPNAAGVTFNWVVPASATINSGQGTNIINVTFYSPALSDTISVTKVTACGSSPVRTLVVKRNDPTATVTTTGPTTFCSGANALTLTANAGTGYTYQWVKGSANISGATNQNYLPTASASYKVIVTNAAGCSKTSGKVTVTVQPLPAATITPQGPTTFCAGGSVVLAANSGTGFSYQWKKGTNNISGATLQNYTATTAGTYKVIVTNANSCSKTSAGTVVTVNCREGKLASDINTLDVFPNPVNGIATIKVGSSTNQSSELSITDITGRVMLTQNIDVTEGENNYTLDLSTFSSGVYLVKIKTGNNVLDKRIIIN